ncbi:MAG: hypothetical protein KJ718_03875 [Nanoarchaeota archaeon]|nr:hypothetical protein [Nanoarchaeota archaeon]MBU1051667.1 hypothetical protein [Nanoarchaeota archaeon]
MTNEDQLRELDAQFTTELTARNYLKANDINNSRLMLSSQGPVEVSRLVRYYKARAQDLAEILAQKNTREGSQ